jgi:hypothetical protein
MNENERSRGKEVRRMNRRGKGRVQVKKMRTRRCSWEWARYI